MSRWGWNEVAPLLLMILALYFLLRAVRDQRASDYALGGLFLGLSHYTYLASRLALVTVLLYLLYRVVFERGFLRRQWRGLAIFFVLYLAVISPLLVTYVRNPFTFSNRSSQVSIVNDMQAAYLAQQTPAPKIVGQVMRALGQPKEISLLPLQESIIRHLEMFHAAGDRNPRHNLPGAPMVDPVTGSLLILALGFAIFQVFRPNASPDGPGSVVTGVSGGHRYALLLLWLLVPLLGGILTRLDEAPQAYRTLASVGAVALLAGRCIGAQRARLQQPAAARGRRVALGTVDSGRRHGAAAALGRNAQLPALLRRAGQGWPRLAGFLAHRDHGGQRGRDAHGRRQPLPVAAPLPFLATDVSHLPLAGARRRRAGSAGLSAWPTR